MNIMNIMKHFTGLRGRKIKNMFFYFFGRVQKAVLCSFFFIMFINRAKRAGWARERGAGGAKSAYLMNIMKFYELGVIKAGFLYVPFYRE